MAAALLDINDCNLRLWSGSSRVESPGYALLESRDYRFGEAARAEARLHPRNINNRFWWQLDTSPLQPALGSARHSADLVHAHLLELHRQAGEPEQLLVACPGSMGREQLSLLLGIAQQCPFQIAGLVDRSALLGSAQGGDLHLELQLHQALLTTLERGDGSVRALASTPVPGCGWLQIQERLVEQIASAFIRQTRFDPRRKAETEQQLYDAVPAILAALAQQGDYNVELAGHRARLHRAELAAAGQRLVTAIGERMTEGEILLADPLPALLPGLAQAFAGLRTPSVDALWAAAQAQEAALHGAGAQGHFVDTLPLIAGEEANPAPSPPVAATQPTHLLRGSIARPLGSGPVALAGGASLQFADRAWAVSAAAEINGVRAAAGQPLQSGDRIRVAGADFQLIEVRDTGS